MFINIKPIWSLSFLRGHSSHWVLRTHSCMMPAGHFPPLLTTPLHVYYHWSSYPPYHVSYFLWWWPFNSCRTSLRADSRGSQHSDYFYVQFLHLLRWQWTASLFYKTRFFPPTSFSLPVFIPLSPSVSLIEIFTSEGRI